MKKISTIILASLTLILISFAAPSIDESVYSNKYIKYSVERDGSSAVLSVDVEDINQYTAIYLRRSDTPLDNFSQVKYLSKTKISELASTGKLVDKYPLPGNIDAYYKIVTINDKGIYKSYPSVKLSKY